MTFIKGSPVSLILGVLSGCKIRKWIKGIQWTWNPTLLYISTGVHPKNYLRKYITTVLKKRFFYRLKDKVKLRSKGQSLLITLIGTQDLKKTLSRQKKMEVKIIAKAEKKKAALLPILQNPTGSQYDGIFTDHIQQQPTVLCISWAAVRKKPAHLFLLPCRTLLYPHLEHCMVFVPISRKIQWR